MPDPKQTPYQAQQLRPDPLEFTERVAAAVAWDQAYRFHDHNHLVMLVYLAVAEDADRQLHSPDGYSCVITAEIASMLGLEDATVQPSIDFLVETGLLVEVPARLLFAIPATGYRLSEAHFDPSQRWN